MIHTRAQTQYHRPETTAKAPQAVNKTDAPFAALNPGRSFWAIGDIHGCRDLLDRILPTLTEDPVIFVGDMIDRGPDSRGVLRRVFELCTRNPETFHALKGNHELLMLQFLENPEDVGPEWTRMGGLQTLASFGISLSTSVRSRAVLTTARDALRDRMGREMHAWLAGLPLIWSSGNVHVVHAGADPARPMGTQDPDSLLWGHRRFARTRRDDGQWVVHGHTIVGQPEQAQGRIAIDTGAYATGVLTAAHILADRVSYVSVGA